ncbi:MAG TPA: HAMP domain-containing sensor histidine kinase [Hydrogenophaga sp.]|nr:HAMP domain-containing sensor histidine kinase [Hydrogenophaga sp.]
MNGLLGQRLYLRIWLAVVGAVAVITLVVGWLWQMALDQERAQSENRVNRTIVVRDGGGEILGKSPASAVRVPGQGLEFQVAMKDGTTLYVQFPRRENRDGSSRRNRNASAWLTSPAGFAWMLGLVALSVALGAYPIVRRLTKRLESLQKGVERWGSGDLSTRLPVHGEDEVAFLATRFNFAAERVQTLLQSHKTLLANASHELRSPLARIRMGLELLGRDSASAAQRSEIARSIDELDQLIDEILLASRLDMLDASDASALGAKEEVDLVGLAAEECARTGADLDIEPGAPSVLVQGHAKLLRRVLRNLLENARRYGTAGAGDDAAQVRLHMTVGQAGGGDKRRGRRKLGTASARPVGQVAIVSVEDRGPGVPADQRERIFEPFYRLPGASEREGGVGLGLSLVKTIVERHGGQIRCEGREGGGARFVVELPL